MFVSPKSGFLLLTKFGKDLLGNSVGLKYESIHELFCVVCDLILFKFKTKTKMEGEESIVESADTLLFHTFLEYDEVTTLAVVYYTAKQNFFSKRGHDMRQQLAKKTCWSDILETLPDAIFRRMFRMDKITVSSICYKIQEKIGVSTFNPECYFKLMEDQVDENSEKVKRINNHFLSGEIKVALTIRLLSGASYLDLLLSYNVAVSTIYDSFGEVLHWINETFNFPLRQWIETHNSEALTNRSNEFAEISDGAFNGVIGAIDER